MSKIFEWIKRTWTIWGGAIAGFVNAMILNFDSAKIQSWISVLMLMLLWAGIFKYIFPIKLKKPLDVMTNNQAINALTYAQNPTLKGEELGESIVKNIKGGSSFMKEFGKKILSFFKWLVGNKKSLFAIVTNVFGVVSAEIVIFTGQLNSIPFISENDLFVKIGAVVLGLIVSANNIYAIINKYGLEKLSDIEARTNELKETKLNQLSKEEKKEINNHIKALEEDLAYVSEQAKPFIKAYELFEKYGNALTNEQSIGYQSYVNSKNVIENKLALEKNKLVKGVKE